MDADEVLDALIALRDAGLVRDRHHLNTAWADLTGRARPAGSPTPKPDATGPCIRCGQRHQRYGPAGQPLCPACRQVTP